jgi:hypothetical protein
MPTSGGRRTIRRAPSLIFGVASRSKSCLDYQWARGFGGRHAPSICPRQLKEVIQVAHTNVGSVAPRGVLVGGEVLR